MICDDDNHAYRGPEIFFFKQLFTEVQLIYNVVLVSRVQQSGSVIHTYIYIYIYVYIYINSFSDSFHYRLLQHISQSFLCYTVGPCCLSILGTVVCICQSPAPNLSLLAFPFANHKFVFYVCESISVLSISSFVSLFQITHISDII